MDMEKNEVMVDLFHELVWECDGYKAVKDYTGERARTDVYRPDGRWIGCSASREQVDDACRRSDHRQVVPAECY